MPLSRGLFALVDAADYPAVGAFKWSALKRKDGRFVAVRNEYVDGRHRMLLLHRWLLGVTDPRVKVDHANGDTLDDRRSNLRRATTQENNRNVRKARGASRFKGVSRNGRDWQAYIGLDGKPTYLGTYATEEEAGAVYDAAARRHFGDFAATNADLGIREDRAAYAVASR